MLNIIYAHNNNNNNQKGDSQMSDETVTDEVATEEVVEQTMAPNGDPDGPALGLVDIKNAVAVIDYAAEQGAFKGWGTINQVIAVRQKLAQFIDAATPQEVKDAEAAAREAAAANSTAEVVTEEAPAEEATA